jgi:hypothetical protein
VSRAIEACRSTSDAKNDPTLRGLCKLIQKFKNRCGTDAMDPKAGTPGVGWAVAATSQKAEAEALAKCRAQREPDGVMLVRSLKTQLSATVPRNRRVTIKLRHYR